MITSSPASPSSASSLPSAMQERVLGICVRNRITEDLLNQP
jgi:hypothetical protein